MVNNHLSLLPDGSDQLHLRNLHAVGTARRADRWEEHLKVCVGHVVIKRDGALSLGETRPGRCLSKVDDVPAGNQGIRPIDAGIRAIPLKDHWIAFGGIISRGKRNFRHYRGANQGGKLDAGGLRFPFEMQKLGVGLVVNDQIRRFTTGPAIIRAAGGDSIVRNALNRIACTGDIG